MNRANVTAYAKDLRASTVLVSLVFYVLGGSLAQASHIIGGQLEMRALPDKAGHFKVGVLYYFDENQTFSPLAYAPLAIYRKRDHQYMTYVDVYNQTIHERPALLFINQPCASQRDLSISTVHYEGELQLNPELYTDPQRYYITYQTCCRNGGISSINRPLEAGYVFYLEFPPLRQGTQSLANSSPTFDPIDGEFICLNKPFTMDFAAHDADGDELRYQLVTPLAGFQGANGGQQVRPGPYPAVTWQSGYSATNAIPGNPALRIDERTGELMVTASRVGLFIFAVVVEEYRRGQRLGAVRRDYQLLVVDCPANQPPDPVLTMDGQLTATKQVCAGQTVTLTATTNPAWSYQWRRNGQSLSGATSATLITTQAGSYQVVTTLRNQCALAGRSAKLTVTVVQERFPLTTDQPALLCQAGARVLIMGKALTAQRYQWYDQTGILPGSTATFSVSQPGQYWLVVTDPLTGCQQRSDTIQVRGSLLPQPELVTTGSPILCPGDSLRFSLAQSALYRYQWLRNEQPLANGTQPALVVKQAGQYSLQVTDSVGCSSQSKPQSVSVLSPLSLQFAPLSPQCAGAGTTSQPLQASPAGGVFTGPGVRAETFAPRDLVPGSYTLRYEVRTGSLACQQGQITQTVVVRASPVVALGHALTSWRGTAVTLPGPLATGYRYAWQPTTGLDDPSLARPLATPTAPTLYTLTVTDSQGCQGVDAIWVHLQDRLLIPTAFSPNGDGINDVWQIQGLDAWPDADILLYNRWGELIHSAKATEAPFTGQVKGNRLPPGGYPYRIQIPQGMTYQGTLFIF